MCLKKIEENIKIKKYKSPQAFVDDVILMFNNCRLYNGPESEYTETADELEIVFAETMAAILPSHSSKATIMSSRSSTDTDDAGHDNSHDKKIKKKKKTNS